jgi:protein-disulfide isomerase
LLGAGAFGIIAGGGAYVMKDRAGEAAPRIALASAALPKDRAGLDAAIRDYILTHPEIIPQAMEQLQNQQAAKTVTLNRKQIETPFAGAWAGNPAGDVTLVMFSDYACGFCKASAPDIDRLLKEDKGLKVVWRELPVLGPESEVAARVGLAAAKQGRFWDFHNRMFAANGALDDDKIAVVQKAAALDPARVRTDGSARDVSQEISANLMLARTLRISGTPSFIVGDQLLQGAVGYDTLRKAISDHRAKRG